MLFNIKILSCLNKIFILNFSYKLTESFIMNINILENILKDLVENFGAIGLRADLASANISIEELKELRYLSHKLGVELTLKIGGCDATNDIYIAKEIGVNSIIAPMIETPYALTKFIKNCQKIYSNDELEKVKLYPNIETITAYKNFADIISSQDAQYITGIVLGRDDMVGSMNLTREEVNSDKILWIARNLQEETFQRNKEFVLGGEIRPKAISFINNLNSNMISRCETRMLVFDGKTFTNNNIEEKISKALEFEISWLEHKENKTAYDVRRIEKLRSNILNTIN